MKIHRGIRIFDDSNDWEHNAEFRDDLHRCGADQRCIQYGIDYSGEQARLRCFCSHPLVLIPKRCEIQSTLHEIRDFDRWFLEISCQNYQKCIYSVILTVETELYTRTTDKCRACSIIRCQISSIPQL